LRLLEKTAQLKSEDASVQSELGLLYSQLRLRDKAVPHLEAALALSPNTGRILADVGEAYENLGERRKALRYIGQALQNGWTLDDLQRNPDLRSLLLDNRFQQLSRNGWGSAVSPPMARQQH
jgi:tetratricopeptide (TPR) repeat protein